MKKHHSTRGVIILALSLMQLFITPLRAQNEIAGYTFAGIYNGHSYYLSDCTSDLFNALTAATEMGGYLVTLSNMDENAFVASQVTDEGAWLGSHMYTLQLWLNGDPLTFENWDPVWEPFVSLESHAAIYPTGYWRPFYPGQLLRYIVEFDSNPDCNNPNKQYICHNGNTICVNNSSVQSHLDHGDYLGPCSGCNDPMALQIIPSDNPEMEEHQMGHAIYLDNTIINYNEFYHAQPDLQEKNFNVYPNPSNDEFTLRMNSTETSMIIRVMDTSGKIVESQSSITGGTELRFGSDLTPGLYFAEVIMGSEQIVLKVIKVK